MIVILSILFLIITFLLVFMVVITPSQEGGMAAAFGGMGSDTFFGTKAHQHINKFTIFLATAFILLAILINTLNGQKRAGKEKQPEQPTEQKPSLPH